MAYDRSPIGRMIIYRLAEVAIKMGNCEEARDYYQEFVEIAPHDNLKYVLRYEISKAEGADLQTLIGILSGLVGSEMCIRDRSRNIPRSGRLNWHAFTIRRG